MIPTLLTLTLVVAYIVLLFVVSHLSGSNHTVATPKRYPRWVVTLAMVGAAITGITFISLPGSVGEDAFSYLQMNLGFIVAYVVIAYWLIPLYYRHNVVSLYEYLNSRFGKVSHTAGAWLNFKKEKIPISMAWLLFMIQNAPPIINMKIMIELCFSNPLNKAENICHVCGSDWYWSWYCSGNWS